MTDPLRRALRGLLQLGVAETLVQFVEAFVVHLDEAQHVALLGIINLVVTFAQNWLEDTTAMPALLKAPPSAGVNPVPDEAGHVSTGIVTAVASVICAAVMIAWAFDLGPFSP